MKYQCVVCKASYDESVGQQVGPSWGLVIHHSYDNTTYRICKSCVDAGREARKRIEQNIGR